MLVAHIDDGLRVSNASNDGTCNRLATEDQATYVDILRVEGADHDHGALLVQQWHVGVQIVRDCNRVEE